MNKPRQSMFRNALQLSPGTVESLGEQDLNMLVGQLLRAQAYRCGCPLSEIFVNTEGQASDDGCDAWSGQPRNPDEWLGSVKTCWQLKAGTAGQPAKLKGEVGKRIPRETLMHGGRYVVIASGSTNGKKGEDERLASLIEEAKAEGIPTENIVVLGSERLASWCNQHPAVAAYWTGRSEGLWTLDDWSNADEHQASWQGAAGLQADLDARRRELDPQNGSIFHLHISGPSGVGKTRLALELCHGAEWRSTVLYYPQAEDQRVFELLDGVAADPGVQLILVADEVQSSQLRNLRDAVGRGGGRIRLITIGSGPTIDPVRIPALEVKPIDQWMMSTVVNGWYPEMPPEHVEFVVRFADGYVRLARLTADAVYQSSAADVRELLGQDSIQWFLDDMLGAGDRRALHVVAVMRQVGWSGDLQAEGEAVAQHLGGQSWDAVRAAVADFDRRLGIARQGGRYRYVSPTPLGIYLAAEAWNTYPDKLRTLPDALPTDDARDSFYERVEEIATSPQARRFAREELANFHQLADFQEVRRVRRWSALSSADFGQAARRVHRALSQASPEERERISWNARSEIVSNLVRLAWKQSSFHEAVTSLALLAEAERETWANNASGAFVTRFQLYLGGTSVPYRDRLSVLDELFSKGRPHQVRLVVEALAEVGKPQDSRGSTHIAAELPEKEWQPNSKEEEVACLQAATKRLIDVAQRQMPEMAGPLLKAAEALSLKLYIPEERMLVAGFFQAMRTAYPASREPLRRIIADIIHREKFYWQELSAAELHELEVLHASFEEHALTAQLEQHVGHVAWDVEDRPDLKPLARELLAAPNSLEELWPWLTSGSAEDAWRLGEALSAVDPTGSLAERLSMLPNGGPDLRLLAGYVHACRQLLGDGWFDRWFTAQSQREPKPVALLFNVAWRCGPPTEIVARNIVATIRSEPGRSQSVGQLGFGIWSHALSVELLKPILQALVDTGAVQTAVQILADRMKSFPAEAEEWKVLAFQLVTKPELIRGPRNSYQWREVAKLILPAYPQEIAQAILGEQGHRQDSGIWFIGHSPAEEVLADCVKLAPREMWQAIQPHLSSRIQAQRFSVGFPRGVIERLSISDEIMAWVAHDPQERAEILALFTGRTMAADDTLSSRILGQYGDDEKVASAFFSAFMAGLRRGPASRHWEQRAAELEAIAARTSLPKLGRWARESARDLRDMAERDRQYEEESALRTR